MAQLLTEAWLHDLADAGRAARAPQWPVGQRLVIEQVITRTRPRSLGDGGNDDKSAGDGGDVSRWALEICGEGVRVAPGGAPGPDLTLITDVATASAIARGALNAQQALAAGHLRLRGDLTRLAALHDALAALGDVFAAVRETTKIPGA